MAEIISVPINNGIILIEAESSGTENVSAFDKAINGTEKTLERAQQTITSMAESMMGAIKKLDKAVTPDQFVMSFSIKFNAEGQAVIAKASAESSLQITMTYNHTKTGKK